MKNVFQLHGAEASGRVVIRKQVRRNQLPAFFSSQPQCIVAMEAGFGANFWTRELGRLGHETQLIPTSYVKPSVKRQKDDIADAEAICKAAQRFRCILLR
jgi:transposase